MQIFISWSGRESHAVAQALSDWIPNVLQSAQPWFSPESLQKGVRWADELFTALERSKVGIFCITPSNVGSPWVSFEAAACSTKIGGRVFTLLHRIAPAEVGGPLAIFNHTVTHRDDIARLMNGINAQLDIPLSASQLEKAFDRWWPDLEQALLAVPREDSATSRPPPRDAKEIASETYDLVKHLSTEVERLFLVSTAAEAQAATNPNQTLELELEIGGHIERTRPMRYPPSTHDVALHVVDLLIYMFEAMWLSIRDYGPPAEGLAIARIGRMIFRFTFTNREDPVDNTIQRFTVELEGDAAISWHGYTNIAIRG